MAKRHTTAKKAVAHNLRDVMANGPRLSYNRKTGVLATCQATGRMLVTGLGAMGVGTMWMSLEPRRCKNVPDYPTEDSAWVEHRKFYWGES